MQNKSRLLIVDDEEINLAILEENISSAGYATDCVSDGLAAWNVLDENPDQFDAVLLDRQMPGMDGIELLQKIKADPRMHMMPVILQTAKTSPESVQEGLDAGCYYYLTKPLDSHHMVAIVHSAVKDFQQYKSIKKDSENTVNTLRLLNNGEFQFRTLGEARDLVSLISSACPNGAAIALGLSELMINAVEHGNLGITYAEKSDLNANANWEDEVNRRLLDPQYKDKVAKLVFERNQTDIKFKIEDQGDGFNWEKYIRPDPARAFDNHGRGISMANMISFDQIQYLGKGNVVVAVKSIADSD